MGDDEYNYHDFLQFHLIEGIGHCVAIRNVHINVSRNNRQLFQLAGYAFKEIYLPNAQYKSNHGLYHVRVVKLYRHIVHLVETSVPVLPMSLCRKHIYSSIKNSL